MSYDQGTLTVWVSRDGGGNLVIESSISGHPSHDEYECDRPRLVRQNRNPRTDASCEMSLSFKCTGGSRSTGPRSPMAPASRREPLIDERPLERRWPTWPPR